MGIKAFFSEQLRDDDIVANIKKQAREAITIVKALFQINLKILTRRHTQQKLQKKNSKVGIQDNSSSDQRLSDDEFTDEEMDGIIDLPHGTKLLSVAGDTRSCLW